MEPVFLSLAQALEMHAYLVDRFGGSHGVRDTGLLESALAMPSAGFGDQYLHTDLFEMASAYLYHIVNNHPFVDGNKRTGAAAAGLFLKMNGVRFHAPEGAFERLVLDAVEGKAEKPAIATFFREHSAER
jgi:death-on-curing protein